jgi:hypothetical protein
MVGVISGRTGTSGDLHWQICIDIVCRVNVMSFNGLLEIRKSKSEDLGATKSRSGSARSSKGKRRKESEDGKRKKTKRQKQRQKIEMNLRIG